MTPKEIYFGSDGKATMALYGKLNTMGAIGIIAMNLFRACKASERAKVYSRKWSGTAYDKKQWSLDNAARALVDHCAAADIVWGWKQDPNPPIGFPWVLYIDTPGGQVSYHSRTRGVGPDYMGDWNGAQPSSLRIIRWVEMLLQQEPTPIPMPAKDHPDNLCLQCGGTETEISNIDSMGEPWKVVLRCKICDVAAIGNTQADAEKNFSEGNYTLETRR
jgi:hypothetical protein